jgi:hypothetical protein
MPLITADGGYTISYKKQTERGGSTTVAERDRSRVQEHYERQDSALAILPLRKWG